jgi:hypothetical protein
MPTSRKTTRLENAITGFHREGPKIRTSSFGSGVETTSPLIVGQSDMPAVPEILQGWVIEVFIDCNAHQRVADCNITEPRNVTVQIPTVALTFASPALQH